MEWRNVKGLEKYYAVSENGAVMNLATGCVIAPYITRCGYVQYNLHATNKVYKRYAHRMVAECFVDNPLSKTEVNHKDRNKQNNAFLNLEWVTHKENMNHWQSQIERIDNRCKCGKPKTYGADVCKECWNKSIVQSIPECDDLRKRITESKGNFSKIAREYGVSDNCIRNWCRRYGLPYHSMDYRKR